MASTHAKHSKAERQAKAKAARLAAERAEQRRTTYTTAAIVAIIVVAVGILYGIYRSGSDPSAGSAGSDKYPFQVGEPGPGDRAIDFTLPSTDGGEVSLSDLRGEMVLLYFHEGLGCQPCWDQIRDIEADMAEFEASGIDQFYSLTSGPLDLIAQKMSDDGLDSVALADSDLAVSKQYEMNQYGMMGDSANGHSFLLVGPDGTIQRRADYGGEPNYTMWLPVDQILADMRAGRAG